MNAKETLKFIEQIRLTERMRITNWVNNNRRYIELEAGIGVYRDSFNSEDLLAFLNEETNEEVS